MKKYNYFYDGTPIPKKQFLKAVSKDWENYVENGIYSFGYYTAIEIE